MKLKNIQTLKFSRNKMNKYYMIKFRI